MLLEYAQPIPQIRANASELSVAYPNGSSLTLYGSENVDSLRGLGLHGCALDENSQQPSNIFSEIISKCLADNLGYNIWLGTPKGKNQFYKTYQNSQKSKDYLSVFRTIEDTFKNENGPVVDNLRQAYEDDKRLVKIGEMTTDELMQEWHCSFEAAIKGAYYAQELEAMRQDGRIKQVPYDTELPVYDVWDLGTGNKLSIGFYQKVGNEVRMIDYWEGQNTQGIKDAVRECKNKPYVYGKHFAPHDIRQTEISSGMSRWDTAKGFGWKFEIVPSVSIEAGIEKGKLFFSRLWVDETACDVWVDAISQYRQEWDDKRGCFKDKPLHDWTSHKADIHRYAALVEKQMSNEVTATWTPPSHTPTSEYEG
jgi:hypothetical protein|tara:strand:- start:7881 stop:8978 length:1098 start_codon:yes stop_codon:yes gene_type:complete